MLLFLLFIIHYIIKSKKELYESDTIFYKFNITAIFYNRGPIISIFIIRKLKLIQPY